MSKVVQVPLFRFASVLPAVEVDVAGAKGTWLLDTGAGVTCLDVSTARAAGINAWGRLVGHRMTGERVELQRADDVTIRIGDTSFAHETIAVTDLGALLPPEMGTLNGAVSLATFAHNPVTLDLPRSRLLLESPASLAERTARADELTVRVVRSVGGRSVDLFLEIESRRGPLLFELDSGCTGPSIVAPHVAEALDFAETEPGCSTQARLPVRGTAPVETPCVVKDIVYDGVLGLSMLNDHAVTLDLAAGRAWLQV